MTQTRTQTLEHRHGSVCELVHVMDSNHNCVSDKGTGFSSLPEAPPRIEEEEEEEEEETEEELTMRESRRRTRMRRPNRE